MFLSTGYAMQTRAQISSWIKYTEELRKFEVRQIEASDRWVFHGTSVLRAACIARDGFMGKCADGVFWGTLETALSFAAPENGFVTDDHPAVIGARLVDVLASGVAEADLNWDMAPPPRDWAESLEQGAFLVRKGYHVRGIEVLSPDLTGLPLHPMALEHRAIRIAQWSPSSDTPDWLRTVAVPSGHQYRGDEVVSTWEDVEITNAELFAIFGPDAADEAAPAVK